MTTVPYTYTRSVGAVDLIVDLECELDCIVETSAYANPEVTVTGVEIVTYRYCTTRCAAVVDKRSDLLASDSKANQLIARDIIDAAKADADFIARATEAAGIHWHGRGPNDPEGTWKQEAA